VSRLLAVAPNPSIDRFFRLDRLALGDINRPTVEVQVAGGKGLNVARAATALGADVAAAGILAGFAGRWIEAQMRSEGVEGLWAWVDGETRACVAIADDTSGALTELNEPGPTVRPTDVDALLALIDDALANAEVGLLTVSGSLPPGAAPDGVARIVALGRDRGVPAVVDAAGEPLALAMAERPWAIKVNLREATAALQGTESPGDATAVAAALARRSGAIAIVTLGPDGAICASPDTAAPVHVGRAGAVGPYPVGSGDAFLAGFAVATLDGAPLAEAVRLAAGAAAANALVPGAGRLDATVARRLARETSVG